MIFSPVSYCIVIDFILEIAQRHTNCNTGSCRCGSVRIFVCVRISVCLYGFSSKTINMKQNPLRLRLLLLINSFARFRPRSFHKSYLPANRVTYWDKCHMIKALRPNGRDVVRWWSNLIVVYRGYQNLWWFQLKKFKEIVVTYIRLKKKKKTGENFCRGYFMRMAMGGGVRAHLGCLSLYIYVYIPSAHHYPHCVPADLYFFNPSKNQYAARLYVQRLPFIPSPSPSQCIRSDSYRSTSAATAARF